MLSTRIQAFLKRLIFILDTVIVNHQLRSFSQTLQNKNKLEVAK